MYLKVMAFTACAVLSFLVPISCAYAGDPRCNAPPYGGDIGKFKSFVNAFGPIIEPAKLLPGICNAKFGAEPRTWLYNLGLTDREINDGDVSDLAVEAVKSLKNLVDHTN